MIELAEMQPRAAMPKIKFEPLAKEIFTLKKQLNAVILAHNYQVPEIQDVADFVGDSLGLAQQAAATDADVIVFCGVHFMAETAKILNPNKIVVLPDKNAGCSLEESCPAEKLAARQKTNPNFWTIAYINCSAAVKALCDVIVTSGNAEKIVNAAPKDKDLLFVPDENLVTRTWSFSATKCGRRNGSFPTRKSLCIPKVCAKCATWQTRFARRKK